MQQTNKKLKIAVGVFAGILAVILIAGLVLNISLLTKVNAQGKLLNSTLNKNGGETTEDGLFTIDALRCIGACAIAPAVTVNGKVYPHVNVKDVPKIIEDCLSEEAAKNNDQND